MTVRSVCNKITTTEQLAGVRQTGSKKGSTLLVRAAFCVTQPHHGFTALETDAALHSAALAFAGPSAVEGECGAGGRLHGQIT